MHFTTLLSLIAVGSTTGWAAYVLEDDYMSGGNFFDQFTFWDQADPTNGFVAYQSQADSQSQGLISSSANNVRMGVDHTNVTPNGRPSVRITSNKSYDSGLVILDLDHMPGGICGTWPAFWMVGPDWPNQGEIDIVEGVNDQTANAMTLHTGDGCSISTSSKFTGSVATDNCDVNAAGQAENAGCGIRTTDDLSYGTGFNSNGGGVYATEWTGNAITMYFFPRNSIPSDITSGNPDPNKWGEPYAKFEGSCDFSTKFTNQQIVFDTTFCGDWAGNTWSSSSCASKASTCNAFVENNPSAFQDAYWSVNGLKVYSNGGGSSPSSAGYPGPSSSAAVSQPQPSAGPTSAPVGSAPPGSWGSPSGAPSAPPAQQSSFVTKPSSAPANPSAPAPSAPAPPGSNTGWAPAVTNSGAVVSSPQSGPTSAPAAPPQPSSPGQWHPSHTWGPPGAWQSGGWNEYENSDGSYAVGVPVQNRRRGGGGRRHYGHHGLHAAGKKI